MVLQKNLQLIVTPHPSVVVRSSGTRSNLFINDFKSLTICPRSWFLGVNLSSMTILLNTLMWCGVWFLQGNSGIGVSLIRRSSLFFRVWNLTLLVNLGQDLWILYWTFSSWGGLKVEKSVSIKLQIFNFWNKDLWCGQ